MKYALLIFTLSAGVFCSSSTLAFGPAGDSSENVIKYRQYVMASISSHFKALKYLTTGRITQPRHWLPHARAMVDMGNMIETSFPKGSDFGNTEARKSIWKNKGDFNQKALKFIKASKTMVKLIEAKKMDEAREQFEKIRQTCKSCHKKYREL